MSPPLAAGKIHILDARRRRWRRRGAAPLAALLHFEPAAPLETFVEAALRVLPTLLLEAVPAEAPPPLSLVTHMPAASNKLLAAVSVLGEPPSGGLGDCDSPEAVASQLVAKATYLIKSSVIIIKSSARRQGHVPLPCDVAAQPTQLVPRHPLLALSDRPTRRRLSGGRRVAHRRLLVQRVQLELL